MTYIIGPLVLILVFFLMECLRGALINDYNTPEWMRFIGHIVFISIWGFGIYSVAVLGHYIVTGNY